MLPTALSGIITGVMLALARVMGETAPVLVLVGYAPVDQLQPVRRQHGARCRLSWSPSCTTRPTPVPTAIWGAALTLILLIVILNLAGRASALLAVRS